MTFFSQMMHNFFELVHVMNLGLIGLIYVTFALIFALIFSFFLGIYLLIRFIDELAVFPFNLLESFLKNLSQRILLIKNLMKLLIQRLKNLLEFMIFLYFEFLSIRIFFIVMIYLIMIYIQLSTFNAGTNPEILKMFEDCVLERNGNHPKILSDKLKVDATVRYIFEKEFLKRSGEEIPAAPLNVRESLFLRKELNIFSTTLDGRKKIDGLRFYHEDSYSSFSVLEEMWNRMQTLEDLKEKELPNFFDKIKSFFNFFFERFGMEKQFSTVKTRNELFQKEIDFLNSDEGFLYLENEIKISDDARMSQAFMKNEFYPQDKTSKILRKNSDSLLKKVNEQLERDHNDALYRLDELTKEKAVTEILISEVEGLTKDEVLYLRSEIQVLEKTIQEEEQILKSINKLLTKKELTETILSNNFDEVSKNLSATVRIGLLLEKEPPGISENFKEFSTDQIIEILLKIQDLEEKGNVNYQRAASYFSKEEMVKYFIYFVEQTIEAYELPSNLDLTIKLQSFAKDHSEKFRDDPILFMDGVEHICQKYLNREIGENIGIDIQEKGY